MSFRKGILRFIVSIKEFIHIKYIVRLNRVFKCFEFYLMGIEFDFYVLIKFGWFERGICLFHLGNINKRGVVPCWSQHEKDKGVVVDDNI